MEVEVRSIVGVYPTMEAAEAAIHTLSEAKFPIDHVSVIAQNLQSEKQVHGFVTTSDVAKSGASVGAWTGGVFGLLLGAAFLWVPGFGPLIVAGPLSAALLGGLEGALAGAAGGGLLGALVGWGISKEHILKYEEAIKAGQYVLVVHGNAEEIARARELLETSNVGVITQHGATAA
ncbi:general stress protein [Chloroflexus sp.]|uniref:general stress protein n=1 Tax=Chloroflexus sp. TaxID=1904827 RepID=UPI00298EFA14|nr:general stress protein [Chloroflexus sp.]MDW8402974.1 general stress protein [Chloroflexus sp.]